MSLELRYDRLTIERYDVDNSAQTVVEGSVTLPDGAKEIGRGLRLTATPRVTELEVKDDRVIFEGHFDLDFLYVYFEERRLSGFADIVDEDEAADVEHGEPEIVIDEKLTHCSWKGQLPFAYVLELPGVKEGQEVETELTVGECSFEVRSDQVTLDVDVALELRAFARGTTEVIAATAVAGSEGIESTRRNVRIKNHLGRGRGEGTAEGELPLTGRAVPESILDIEAKVDVTEAVVDDGQVRAKGNVSYRVVYVGQDDSGVQCVEWLRGATFDVEVVVEGARRGARAEVKVCPGVTRSTLSQGEGGEALAVRTPITISVDVAHVQEVALVTGLESDEKEVVSRVETVSLREAVGEGSATESVEGTLDITPGSPPVDRVLAGHAKARVEDVHVLGDKVAIEVHVDAEMLYVGRDQGGSGVHIVKWPEAFSVDLELPVPGAEPGMERNVKVDVTRVDVDPINRESLDVRVQLAAKVELTREIECDVVVEAVEVLPAESNPPTYTFVVIDSGDTLWKVAARYRSQTEAILAVNPWLDEVGATLPAGRKLCVPRKAVS